MSDMIWRYCCLMGGTSASSTRGIRTSTAGAVSLDPSSQLLLLQHLPQTLPDNLHSGCTEFRREEGACAAPVVAVEGWMRTRMGR